MVFWILTGAVALVVAAGLGWSVLRGTRETGPAEAFDMQVYRDQLAEIDSDAVAAASASAGSPRQGVVVRSP